MKIGKTTLTKGDHYYLDSLHKNHIEVFDKFGNFRDVLDLNGNHMKAKFNDAKNKDEISRVCSVMEETYLQVISWLENSGYMPEESEYDIECAKENIPGSLQTFFDAFKELSQGDYQDPDTFETNLHKMNIHFMDLRCELQNIEEALRKTVVHGHHNELIVRDDDEAGSKT